MCCHRPIDGGTWHVRRMFCQATGFGGTVQQGRTVEAKLREREQRRDEALEAAAAAREVRRVPRPGSGFCSATVHRSVETLCTCLP